MAAQISRVEFDGKGWVDGGSIPVVFSDSVLYRNILEQDFSGNLPRQLHAVEHHCVLGVLVWTSDTRFDLRYSTEDIEGWLRINDMLVVRKSVVLFDSREKPRFGIRVSSTG